MIRVELRKQALRMRTYIGMAMVVVLPVIITIALKFRPARGGGDNGEGIIRLATSSGINMPLAALTFMSGFFLVVVVSLFAGETVAGEANWGTLRYLLVRPVGRYKLLMTKLVVAVLLSLLATALISVVALIAGTAFFGWHPVLTTSLTTLSQGTALVRLLVATLYVALGMASFIAFAFMLSTMTDSAFGAVAGGVALGVISQILDGVFTSGWFRYGFPTHYLDAWHGLFASPTMTANMVRGALVQVPYAVVFVGIGLWWFRRKDVLS
ncbi:MAG: ABC transporter permease, partial [Acidimicrobiales bacterium]